MSDLVTEVGAKYKQSARGWLGGDIDTLPGGRQSSYQANGLGL